MSDVTDAQNGDQDAITAVLRSEEGCIATLAGRAALRMGRTGYRDGFVQDARMAVFEAIGRYDSGRGTTFCSYAWHAIEMALADAVRNELCIGTGVDADAAKVFGSMLKLAGGDPYMAERLSKTRPPKGRRLGADRASAARLAYTGARSLDVPIGEGGLSFGDTLAARAAEVLSAEQQAKCQRVRVALLYLGRQQRAVLSATYGIWGAELGSEHDAELADRLGTSVKQVQSARTQGLRKLAEVLRYMS